MYDEGHPYQSYDPNWNPDETMKMLHQLQNRIASTVTDLGKAFSMIEQTAYQITLKVSKVDFNGETITSLIVQDAYSINLLAERLNFEGLVTFRNLETPGETVIDGGNIYGNLFSVGNGVTQTRLELFTSDEDYHYIYSNRYGAGSSEGSSIYGGLRIIVPNGPITLAPNAGTGVYVVGAPLVLRNGLRVNGTSQFDWNVVINDHLSALSISVMGESVATQTYVWNAVASGIDDMATRAWVTANFVKK